MTTALRLPDPLTPDMTTASAATPTCCPAVPATGVAIAPPSTSGNDPAYAAAVRATGRRIRCCHSRREA